MRWLTIRSDNNDKFAQPDGEWIGAKGKPTNVSYDGPGAEGRDNVVLPGVDHRESSFSPQAFAADLALHHRRAAHRRTAIVAGSRGACSTAAYRIRARQPPASGNYANNLPLAGARRRGLRGRSGHRRAPRRAAAAAAPSAPTAAGDRSTTDPTTPLEFVISAPGFATTHIYRVAVPALVRARPPAARALAERRSQC